MVVVDRYPTWALLLLAVAAVGLLAGSGMYLDRSSRQRRAWIWLLVMFLVIVGLARAGVIPSRGGGLIPPNAGLLVVTDIVVALFVVIVFAAWWQRRPGHEHSLEYGRWAVLPGVAGVVLLAAALFGEIELAYALPAPPAVAACDDYDTWVLAPGNGSMTPMTDQAVLARAAREAPPGQLRRDLAALNATVQTVITGQGTAQGLMAEDQMLEDEGAVTFDCRLVPPG